MAPHCDDTVDKKRVNSCVIYPAKMAEKWPRFGGPRPSWELAWTMNWVDWLRTKRMWSGRRAVVMVRWAAVGCGCSALICCSSWTGDWAAGHEGYPPPDCSGQGEGQSFLAWSWGFPRSHCRAVVSDVLCVRFICTFCMRVCIYVYVCMCADMIYVYICMCVCICTSMRLLTCVFVCVCIFVHRLWVLVSVLQRVDGVMHAHVFSCAYACVYICV